MKLKKGVSNIIFIIIICACIICLMYSVYNITIWFLDRKNTNNQITELVKTTVITEVTEAREENITNINPPNEKENTKASNIYWEYMKEKLIDVNFDTLLEKNKDTVAWLQVKGTNINYPVVQTDNNDYYLNHSFDKTKNKAGWVFMDFRNDNTLNNQNTIIYAHGRLDKTMFGTLKNIISNGWYSNSDNHLVKTSTKNANYLWQVFSVYTIPVTSDYLRISFQDEEDALNFFKMLQERSNLIFNVTLYGNDKILTLSTCYKNTGRVVLHAKLIKLEKK